MLGLPRWLSGKEPACHCRRCKRHGLDPWVGKISWRRKWQPTSVFLSRKFYGQRSLAGYSSWSCKELDMTERMHTHTHTHTRHLPLGLVHTDTKAKSIINTTINHVFGKHKWICWLIKVLIKHLWEQYNHIVLIPRQQVFKESQTSYSILPGVGIKQC